MGKESRSPRGYHAPMPVLALEFDTDARLRTIPEDRIIENIASRAWRRADRQRDPEGVRRRMRDALARWRALGLPCAVDATGERRYDPSEAAIFMRYAGWKGVDPFWREQHLVGFRGSILAFHPPGTPADRAPDPLTLPPRRIVVSMQRRFEPEWIVANARLRIPVPMADETQRDLAMTFDPVDGAEGQMRVADGYAELRLTSEPTVPVVISARFSFIASPSPVPGARESLSPAERERYLHRDEDLVKVTPAAETVARSLTDGVADPLERVRRLYHQVAGRRFGEEFPYALLGIPVPATGRQAGFYDCRMMTALFVALCRAAGIPARRVGGYIIGPEGVAFHHWAETWLEDAGWLPFDSITGETSAVLQDASWIPYFGAIDYRMKTGILPRVFTGSPGVRMPADWTMLERDVDGATCTEVIDAVTMAVVWTDTFRVDLRETQGRSS